MQDTTLKARIKRAVYFILRGVPVQNIKAEIITKASSDMLKGKNIVITGGGRGLGYFIAEKCVAEGGNVLIVGRNDKTLMEAAQKLGGVHYTAYDVTDIENIPSFFDECEEKLGGGIDCLVNNAGVSHHETSFYTVSTEDWDIQFNTNLRAPYFLTQEYSKRYEARGGKQGAILFISSERGFFVDERPYGLIKAAINSLVGGLGCRYISKGIRVNAVAPGVTATDMTGFNKDGDLYYENSCGNRVYMPEEVAEISVFLLSEQSGCISGQIITTNRGNHLRCDW